MCLEEEGTIREGLAAIDAGAAEIAFVCDPAGRVLGCITDGDLRRALLSGAELDSSELGSAMSRDFIAVSPAAGRAEVLDLMRANRVSQIPVIGADGRLRGLHLLHELVGSAERPNRAVLMAGGFGARLRPLTDTVPKPMLPVAGRPILERLVLHLTGHGIHEIFIAVHHLSHVIEDHFGDGSGFGCKIDYLREDYPLGTGGALKLLPEVPTEPLLVMNGDLVTQVDVGRLLDFHEQGSYQATMGLRTHVLEVPYGVVEVSHDRILGVEEKPRHQMLINAGVYVVSPEILARIPGGQDYPITNLFSECLDRGESVGGYVIEEEWVDVGQHAELRKARGDI